jgi:RNA polymerase sigma-70 factor (ECF subfamily)
MNDSPATRASLLVRIRDPRDGSAWSQFVDIYAPLLYGFARKAGLQDADAADVTQEVLRSVAGAVTNLEYDPRRGSFRGWLFTIARNRLRNFQSRKPPDSGSGDSGVHERLQQLAAPEQGQAAWWDQEYERQLFQWAAARIRRDFEESTWQAFWQTAVEGKSGKEVARELRISLAAVYLAKSRVLTRLKEQIQLIQGEF